MKKIMKKWGTGLGIYFNYEDIEIYKLKKGDVIDLEFVIVHNGKNNKGRNK